MKHPIGTEVTIGKPTDDTMESDHIGKKGRVSSYNTNGQTGNTEEDPLHNVLFADGSGDSFWYEELIPA